MLGSFLRSHLKKKLPDYMIPSAFVVLDALPLTLNGKIDRKALPAQDQMTPAIDATVIAPRTPVEAIVASIWSEVLKIDKVGIHDNFFELGGHSLLATQVISRIRSSFQNDMPLRTLFDSPTVAEMAAIIVQNDATQADREVWVKMLQELDSMSEEDAEKMLAKDSVRS